MYAYFSHHYSNKGKILASLQFGPEEQRHRKKEIKLDQYCTKRANLSASDAFTPTMNFNATDTFTPSNIFFVSADSGMENTNKLVID